jgi:hypothetical protein
MEASHVRLLAVVGVVLVVSVATADRSGEVPAAEPASVLLVSERAEEDDAGAAGAAEVARIREHLLRVERELLTANVAHLTVAQRQHRALHIEVLREYRERGIFPHNHRVPGRRVPVFIDEHGTHCAVGYLIARSGHEELARRIAATRNLATVPELADVPELVAWLADAGLSVEEAARIQPWYGPIPPQQPVPRTGYDAATAVSATLGAGATVWNLITRRQGDAWWVPGAVGVGTGATGVALAAFGAAIRDDFADVRTAHIAWNAGLGVLSGFLGARTLALGRAPDAAATDADGPPPARLELAAWAPPEGGTGLRLDLRF